MRTSWGDTRTARVLDTEGIGRCYRQIIRESTDFVVVLSPYLSIGDDYVREMRETLEQGVRLYIVCREADLKDATYLQMLRIGGCDIRFVHNLHAKMVVSEDSAVLSSMNLYGFSEMNNEELGISADRDGDGDLYLDMLRECLRIMGLTDRWLCEDRLLDAREDFLRHHPDASLDTDEVFSSRFGDACCVCIRCGSPMPLNCRYVYCMDCLAVWMGYGNMGYVERQGHCHLCGGRCDVSAERPACPECTEAERETVGCKVREMRILTGTERY